jgi:hypothetical protein
MRAPKLFVVILVLAAVGFYGQLTFYQSSLLERCNWPTDFVDPPGYTNPKLDRIFRKARVIVGDRWSHESQGCVEGGRLDAAFGVADLTSEEKGRIEALAPPWLRFDVFETEYSMKEMRAFCDEAFAAVDRRIDVWTACESGDQSGKVGILVTEDSGELRAILEEVLPEDAYYVDIEERASF